MRVAVRPVDVCMYGSTLAVAVRLVLVVATHLKRGKKTWIAAGLPRTHAWTHPVEAAARLTTAEFCDG